MPIGGVLEIGNLLNIKDKQIIWAALSDVFIDNEVDYDTIAKIIKPYDLATVEEIFFSEVAPLCHSNNAPPVPTVWTAFDASWLESQIEARQRALQNSSVEQLKHKVLVAYLKRTLRPEWEKIKSAKHAV
jgi:hypothetical protein